MASRRALIERWYKWNSLKDRKDYDHDMGQMDGGLLTFMGHRISNASASETLAVFIRREREVFVHADAYGDSTKARRNRFYNQPGDMQTLPPLVRLPLPNQFTIGRHRAISSVVRSLGGMAVCVPARVLEAADIREWTIIVVDTEKKPRMNRAPQQLIRAQVAPRWGNGFTRWSYFLSGYDLNEPGLSYFFCELPRDAQPKTLEEAYQALKPESVKTAEAQGKKVKRQGDIFLIPVDPPVSELKGPLNRRGRKESPHSWSHILRTNHAAEERFNYRGLTYVRGRIVHAPLRRRADHVTLRLGRHWHLAVKNTVPVVGRF
jgi:hypothetical protein